MDPEVAAQVIAPVAIGHAREFDAHRIYLPDVCAGSIARSGIWATRFIKHSRPTYCRPGPRARLLREHLSELRLDYADGDIGFA
jgi:hypothetical protein